MKVTLERLPESRVQLDIEVDQDRVDRSIDAAYRRLAPRTKVPGFRPGKAPRNIIEKYLGRQRLMNEALDKLIPDVYNEAIETEDVDAIAQPELDGLELDPVRFKFVVSVRPSVDLGDYKSIRVTRVRPEVTDEQVDEQLRMLQRRHAVYAPVDRPIQWNDMVIANVKGEVEGDQLVAQDDAEFSLREGEVLFVPGLAEAFIGMKKGEDKNVEITLPEDFRSERFQAKNASFALHVSEVKEEELPDLDDDLAQQVNAEQFETLDALKQRIRDDLQEAADAEADTAFRTQALEKLIESSTLEYPRVLVDQELDHIVRETMGGDQRQYMAYLQSVGRSDEEFREMFRERADDRVKRSIVLVKLAEAEGISITPEDIDAEIETMVAPLGDEAERFREMFGGEDGRATIRRNLLSQRTLERLSEIASGEAPDAPESIAPGTDESKPEAPAKPARKSRARARASAAEAPADGNDETQPEPAEEEPA